MIMLYRKTHTKDTQAMLDKYPHRIGKDGDHILYRGEIEYRRDEAKLIHALGFFWTNPESAARDHNRAMRIINA